MGRDLLVALVPPSWRFCYFVYCASSLIIRHNLYYIISPCLGSIGFFPLSVSRNPIFLWWNQEPLLLDSSNCLVCHKLSRGSLPGVWASFQNIYTQCHLVGFNVLMMYKMLPWKQHPSFTMRVATYGHRNRCGCRGLGFTELLLLLRMQQSVQLAI